MQIGISTYAFAWSIGVPGFRPRRAMTSFDFLSAAAELDADCVQIADNIPLVDFTHDKLQKLRDQAQSLDLKIEVGMRGLTVPAVKAYLQIAKFLESHILRVVIDADNYCPAVADICEMIRGLLPLLQSQKIILAIENHDRFSCAELIQMVKTTDERWVGICLDSVNSLGHGQGFAEVVAELLPYTVNVHIKDYTIQRKRHQMGFEVIGTIAGLGHAYRYPN